MIFTIRVLCLGMIAAHCLAASVLAVGPTDEELSLARQWTTVHFEPVRQVAAAAPGPAGPAEPRLVVLANHDRVLVNGRPDGRPLKIGGSEYKRGLLCHAVSHVVVRLPGPGKTFTAIVGVDANAGGGSVVFSVKVGAKEAFRSEVLRGGGAGVPVAIDLAGAREFTIEAGDAGDGIACDHADWAEAKVVLADGKELWLSDLPLLAPELRRREAAVPPFSFVYASEGSDQLLGKWQFAESVERLDARRTQRTQVYTDPRTGLAVRCVLTTYVDYPTVEWTLYFKNTAKAATPILSDVFPLDARFRCGRDGRFLLHHAVGSPCQPNDYQPLESLLRPGSRKRITAASGRPTGSDLSCFNVEWGWGGPGENRSQGVIAAIGWPGQWAADFVRDSSDGLRLCGRQESTHFKLLPGEEVRSPLVVLQFWRQGDWIRAQNVWRRWMIAHNLPRPGGKPPPTHYGSCFGNLLPRADEEIAVIGGFLREGITLDYWFLDAGWYPNGGAWWNTGTWEVDQKRFPRGLREVADLVHAKGIKFVVWFEPERVTAGSWLARNHPEWVLGGSGGGLLNLGNREAWSWCVEHVDRLIASEGVDVYRQDFNIEPLGFWNGNDAADRRGISEIKHVTGYLAYWDELCRRHPELLIDTCASGGRRNDLETLRRSVPLLRSDYFSDPVAQQCQTYGISLWIPYYGSGMTAGDRYWFRSCIFPASRIGWDARDKNLDYALLRRMIAEFRQVAPYLLGDFWPLAPYSLAGDVWMAWQYDRPERGEGMVQAFRRAGSPVASSRLKLRGLVPEARYRLTNLDEPVPIELGGRELMERGLPVTIAGRPGAIIVVYRQVVGRQQVHRFRADRGDPFVHLPGEAVEPLKAYSELAGRRRTSSTP